MKEDRAKQTKRLNDTTPEDDFGVAPVVPVTPPPPTPVRYRIKEGKLISLFGAMTWKPGGEIISSTDYGFDRLQMQLDLEVVTD